MSLSLNQLLSYAKARPIILMPAALLVVTVIGYVIFSKPSKETLIKNLTSQLREEQFEQLYADADDSVHLNVTKERFVKRMKIAVAKLKAIDKNLAFQVDVEGEMSMGRDGGNQECLLPFKSWKRTVSLSALLFIGLATDDFSDLWTVPLQGTSEDYRVLGVSAKHYSVGNQVLDW